MKQLDNLKSWLNSCDIRYTEGVQSLNWQSILSVIREDPEEFFETGGWSFLGNENESQEEDDEDLEKEEDEDFEEETQESDEYSDSESVV